MNAQTFTGIDRYATVDLRHFASVLAAVTEHVEVKAACDAVIASVEGARVADIHLGSSVQDASGIAFWFPSNRLEFASDRGTYEKLDCADKTGWTKYLEAMLTRRE